MRKAMFLALFGCASVALAQAPPRPIPAPLIKGAKNETQPAPPAPPLTPVRENLLTFDPQRVELRWKNNHWQLLAGDLLIKDFGRREADGREVQRLIRELGLTQLGTVGTPLPVMEYWLAGGQAPRNPASRMRMSELDLATLRVEQVQEQWCVRDGTRILFSFGTHKEEAEQALAIFRKHGFTHMGHVGNFPPAMVLLVSKPDRTSAASVASPQPIVPRSSMPGTGSQAAQPSAITPEELPQGRQFNAVPPRPDLVNLAEHVPFDFRQVQVRRDGQEWKLVFGNYVLGSFGANEREARLAHSAIQHYRFNQHCLVGRPMPTFSYFLVNGHAGQGVMLGVRSVPFRPEGLTIRQVDGRWVLGDPSQTLLDFGDRAEEAQQVLKAIQRHRFDHLCRIGQSPGMTFFVRVR